MKCRWLIPALFMMGSLAANVSAQADIGRPDLPEDSEYAAIYGFVKDASSEETLIFANVIFKGTIKGGSTNINGYYSIPNVEPGQYTISCTYVGYGYFEKTVELKAGDAFRLDIFLQPQSFESEELVVTAEAEERERRNIGMAHMNTDVIKIVPTAIEADVFRTVQLLPGIKSASDFSSGLYVRGGGPDQTLILLDQTTVYNPSHFFGFYSAFNSDAIKDVRLMKGGYSANYGGRIGSVLDIYNKDGNRVKSRQSVTVGMLASRALIEGPFKGGSYMLAVRRSTIEPVLAALRPSVDNIPDSFYFLDVNSKVNFDLSPNDKLSASFYMGQDYLVFPFLDDAEIQFYYGNRTFSTKYTHIFSQKLFMNVVGTFSRYFSLPKFEVAGTNFDNINRINDWSVKSDIQYFPESNHKLEAGFWAGNFDFIYKTEFDGSTTFNSGINSYYASAYVQDEWQPTDRWTFRPGIRGSFFGDGNYARLEPRLSTEYLLNPRVRLQAAVGRYYQYLTLVSNESFSGFDFWLTSADDVEPAYGDQFVVGSKIQLLENLNFDVEAYYRTMENLFELDPTIQDPAGVPYDELFRFGKGFAYGTEMKLERTSGKFNGFIGYTYSISRRKWQGEMYGDEFYAPKYDRTHDVNFVMNYHLNKKWFATVVFAYATGQAYTEPLGRYSTHNDPFNGTEQNIFNVGKVNASRLPSYHRMDISATRQGGTFFGMGSTEWKIQAINVYNRKNVWFYNYDFDKNPVKRGEVTMLPILPSISYTVNL